MNTILLAPTDVLFFRDGRPMEGSLSGHSAAWPLPDITNHALHAALHRAELGDVHKHVPEKSSTERDYSEENRENNGRVFGSLKTAGPFPVRHSEANADWFFPRPADANNQESTAPSFHPFTNTETDWDNSSSLPAPLKYAVGNTSAPSKDTPSPWWSIAAWEAYLTNEDLSPQGDARKCHFLDDEDIADREQQIGIAIDPDTGTTGQGDAAGKIYSAHYLRLRPNTQLGLFAEAMDKIKGDKENKHDLVEKLLNGHPSSIIVGGQQRVCTASRSKKTGSLPIPKGLTKKEQFNKLPNGKYAVKWILISPAIFPEIKPSAKNNIPHQGGWLPSWISQDGQVQIKCPAKSKREKGERRDAWRSRVKSLDPLNTHLVGSIIPKPLPVTGWSVAAGSDGTKAGAKSTHLAVPAGAVYYFETDTPETAASLAQALNWHGDTDGTDIQNRRSSLMGEKGFGLGVCGTWTFHSKS